MYGLGQLEEMRDRVYTYSRKGNAVKGQQKRIHNRKQAVGKWGRFYSNYPEDQKDRYFTQAFQLPF